MTRNRSWLGLFAVIVVLTLGTTRAPAQDKADPGDVAKQLQALRLEIKILTDYVTDLNKRLEAVPSETSVDAQIRRALAKTHEEMEALKLQVQQLQREVSALRGGDRKAFAPPVGNGWIRLLNQYPTQMTVIVNDRSYRLEPNADRIIEMPAGAFTYQVLGVQPELLVRTLPPNRTFLIRVYPQFP